MSFSESSIRKLIRMYIKPSLKISKTAIGELNNILSEEGAAIAKIALEIADNAKRATILEEDIIEAYSALFL